MYKRIPIITGILVVSLAAWLLMTPNQLAHSILTRLDNLGYDLQLRTRVLTEETMPSRHVAIIDIDDKSLKAEGRWPWPREKLAELVNELQKQGAAVIAFDMFFPEKEANIAETMIAKLKTYQSLTPQIQAILQKNIPHFDGDEVLAKSISTIPTVIATGFLPRNEIHNQLPPPALRLTPEEQNQFNINQGEGYISSIPVLQKAASGGGFINIYPDSDGIIRRAPLIIEYQGGIYPSLALQAVMTFLEENIQLFSPHYGKEKKVEGVQLGSYIIPTDDTGQALIPFIGRSYTFPFYSATDILHHNINENKITGKILFIGTSATGLGDLQPTSIQNPFPGVEIQASMVNGILTHHFSFSPAWTEGANLILTIVFGMIAACLFPFFGPKLLGAVIILFPFLVLFTNNWLWIKTGLVISLLVPVMTIILIAFLNIVYGYLFESRRREHLKSMFGQYVPEKHIDEMLKHTDSYALHGEDREMSVLFADIRSFTTISEGMSALDLVEMLNTFFTPMTEIIFKNSGTIDKYVGDMIMAFWGAPLKDADHAKNAINSAIEMQIKLTELHQTLALHHWPEIHIGIGINSGIMSVGDMGSRYRRNYTVLGDSVNLASRAEGLTKYYGVDIIVTEDTMRNQTTKFIFRKLDKVRVKGKKLGIPIYEVVGKIALLTPELTQELDQFHHALDFYFQQQWEASIQLLNTLKERYSHRKVYGLYLERINEFKANPPPADWDGVYVHTSK